MIKHPRQQVLEEGRVRPLVLAISALGSQLKGLARVGRATPAATPDATPTTVPEQGRGWPGITACLLPWQTMIKPSSRQKLLIDAHRDDWP